MRDATVSNLIRLSERFFRSVHLERDFHDRAALDGYVVTPQVRDGLHRLASGLTPDSGQRAWRVTGDYGSGKSSFALALAHLLSGHEGLPGALRQAVDFRRIGGQPRLLPVLVTGSPEPLGAALVVGVRRALEGVSARGKPPKLLTRARTLEASAAKAAPSDAAVVALLEETAAYLSETAKAAGLLVILDEMGKFLEYAAARPDRQDVYLLQRLAESAARSGDQPLFVVGLLHQGFSAYADHLSEPAQREWEKVAGRFEELLFQHPLDQVAALVADAMNVRVELLPQALARQARRDMEATLALGWFGPAAPQKALTDLAPRLYPLHPTVLPVLARLFHRFGQGERSLFSFLLSAEPFGLRAFAEQRISEAGFYRLHNLYDYARASFGHRLGVQSYRSHWNHIESIVESFPAARPLDLHVLKTVAILNLLDAPPLLASDEAMALAVADPAPGQFAPLGVPAAVRSLQTDKRVLYFRGASGGYCLWPHTSVNLDQAYRDAARSVAPTPRVASLVEGAAAPRPLVARRHYIETGNLRHFRVRYAAVPDLQAALDEPLGQSDGLVLVALAETAPEREQAMDFARGDAASGRPDLLVAVPAPLSTLRGLVLESQRWDWVAQHTPALGNDRYAAEEVSRQVEAARRALQERLHAFIGIGRTAGESELKWFRRGQPLLVTDGRRLLTRLSEVCDDLFPDAPRVRNELLNRHELSSAAAAARMRLIGRLLTSAGQPLLGMDPARKPPEMSMYLSVLRSGRVHRETRGGHGVTVPRADDDPLHIRPALVRILDLMSRDQDRRVAVSDVFADLSLSPYGVRGGIAPLLLAIVAAAHEHEVAFYESGAFVRRMTGDTFMRLVKAPSHFEVQRCRIGGVRAALFGQLLRLLDPAVAGTDGLNVLDVVRPLCAFAAQLPGFTHKTRRLGPAATAVRDALVAALEPATLIFTDLPKACGFPPFGAQGGNGKRDVEPFVAALKDSLDELKASYPDLLHELQRVVVAAFDRPGPFAAARLELAASADRLMIAATDPRLKALCLRLADRQLPDDEWTESLGSFVCSRPTSKWLDADVDRFREELSQLAQLFRRVEATAFVAGRGAALRVAVTLQDGSDVERVVHLDPDEEGEAQRVEAIVASLLSAHGRVGVAAATRAIWRELSRFAAQPAESR